MARAGLASLALFLWSCANFPELEANVCGNAVIEDGEDCDTFAERGRECRPAGVEGECHFDCRVNTDGRRAECPVDMGCAADGICRPPTGDFENGVHFASGISSWLTTADFDGDGRLDVISTEAADELRQARFRIHYFDDDAELDESLTFPRVVTRPIARRLTGDDSADDLLFSNGLIGMVPGRADRAWIPASFSSYVLPGTRLQAVALRADTISQAIGLAIFSDLDGGPAVYVPSLDDSKLWSKAPLERPFEDLLVQEDSTNIFAGPHSPCSEVVYAFVGDDAVHVLDLCERGTEQFGPEVVWRDSALDHVIRLPSGAKVTTAPQTADVDGDGQLDVLVGAEQRTFVALGVGEKLEEVASPLRLRALEDGSRFPLAPPLASADITGDGVIDFVMPTGILASHRSLVDGRVGYFVAHENSAQPWSMARIADLNGNGLPDVIAGAEGSPGLAFLSGTGGPFQNHTRLATQGPLRFLTVGDFDGDLMFDVAYVQSGPSKGGNDLLTVAFAQRDTFPLAERHVAQVTGVQQLGGAHGQGGSSLFTVSRDRADGVTRSKFTLFDGSPERLPFAPYSLVTFSVDGSLQESRARVLTAGALTAVGAHDLLALAEDTTTPTWSMWLVPAIDGAEKPPQRLTIDHVPPDALGVTFNAQGGQLSATAATADLDGDGLDEAVLLMSRGSMNEGCYLLIYALDAGSAKSKGTLSFDMPCPDPELVTAQLDEDEAPDLLVLVGDARVEPRQLRLLLNDGNGGFSVDHGALIGVDGHDVRGVSPFASHGRLAFVTDDGLYQIRRNSWADRFDVSRAQGFDDARSVIVTDPNGDGIEDIAVADAAGVWLMKARFE